MIDEKLLDEAILEVAKKRIGTELRNAIIYGNPEMGEVYNLYLDKVKAKKPVLDELTVTRGLILLVMVLVAGWALWDIYRMVSR
jgi:hypothetical protein